MGDSGRGRGRGNGRGGEESGRGGEYIADCLGPACVLCSFLCCLSSYHRQVVAFCNLFTCSIHVMLILWFHIDEIPIDPQSFLRNRSARIVDSRSWTLIQFHWEKRARSDASPRRLCLYHRLQIIWTETVPLRVASSGRCISVAAMLVLSSSNHVNKDNSIESGKS